MSLLRYGGGAGRRGARAAAAAAGLLGLGVAVSGAGCDSPTVTELPCELDIKSYEAFTVPRDGIRLDLLLSIDNSRSMADKQELLAAAIPDLVEALVNPPCVDGKGALAASQPAGPLDPCPTVGTRRSKTPIVDLHVGVISSSLGGHGSDACTEDKASCPSGSNPSLNDKGHLLARTDPCGGADVPSYQNKSFLAWDPAGLLEPNGEGDMTKLAGALRDMVLGAGQVGCGYEAQLESWYRFLVDPEPYASIPVIEGKATPEGTDEVLLAQRADFMRPDSVLLILMLSDENDCSIREYGQFFFAAQLKNPNGTPFHLPRARSECATNPNDPCCLSCGQNAGSCPPDPTCLDANGDVKALTDLEDGTNLRCFDQKRRFGIDFLHPIDRYTTALTSNTIPNRKGELVPNPIFQDLNWDDDIHGIRVPQQVLLAGVVGVPWQDIARDAGDLSKGFKDAWELLAEDAGGDSAWDIILGDPATLVPPKDPHMIEAIDPRSGTNPVTGDVVVAPGQAVASSINGGEWTINSRDDLQYACAFPLKEPRDCSDPAEVACDCKDPGNDNPLCANNPKNPGSRTLQVKAKAYPGVRELQVLRALEGQGITASVCPANVTSPDAPDYAYRPVVRAILERLEPVVHNRCMATALPVDGEGRTQCRIIEARATQGGACACDASKGRKDISSGANNEGLAQAILKDADAAFYGLDCFCELEQLANVDAGGSSTGALDACQTKVEDFPKDANGEIVNGWCYIDATTTPPTGSPELVAECPETSHRNLRFLGKGAPAEGSTLYLTCAEGC